MAKSNKANYIHRVRRSSLLEIVEKSFPTMYGDVNIHDSDEAVTIKVSTPNQKGVIANVVFGDYEVKVESPIDFPRNEDTLKIRFLDLMTRCFDDYNQNWQKYQAAKEGTGSQPGE